VLCRIDDAYVIADPMALVAANALRNKKGCPECGGTGHIKYQRRQQLLATRRHALGVCTWGRQRLGTDTGARPT